MRERGSYRGMQLCFLHQEACEATSVPGAVLLWGLLLSQGLSGRVGTVTWASVGFPVPRLGSSAGTTCLGTGLALQLGGSQPATLWTLAGGAEVPPGVVAGRRRAHFPGRCSTSPGGICVRETRAPEGVRSQLRRPDRSVPACCPPVLAASCY